MVRMDRRYVGKVFGIFEVKCQNGKSSNFCGNHLVSQSSVCPGMDGTH